MKMAYSCRQLTNFDSCLVVYRFKGMYFGLMIALSTFQLMLHVAKKCVFPVKVCINDVLEICKWTEKVVSPIQE